MDHFFLFFSPEALSVRAEHALAAVLLVILAGAATGPLAGNANPFLWSFIAGLLGKAGDRLDKIHRTKPDLILRGFIFFLFAIAVAFGAARLADYAALWLPYERLAEVLFLSLTLTAGAGWRMLLNLYRVLRDDTAGRGAYRAVALTSRTNLAQTDSFGITRVAMGLSVRLLARGLVAPVFWYVLAGLPGAYIYSAIAALSWRFGKDGFSKGFGASALFFDRILGWIPSVLTAGLVCLGSVFTPTAGIFRGLAGAFGAKSRAPFAQGGLPLSVLAWTFNVSLGGASQDLSGSAIRAVWVGPQGATARNDFNHLRRVLYMSAIAHLVFILMLGALYLGISDFI